MTRTVAVVGAGAAGAGATYALAAADAEVDVTVFEKSRGVCGRAATRRREGCRYDHGANSLQAGDDRVTDLVTERLDTDGLVDITEPVRSFDADGPVAEEDEVGDEDEHRWTYEAGITQVAKRLFGATDATVRQETRVVEPVREDDGWRLYDSDRTDLGWFDALLLTPPAPQTADILGNANWEHTLCRDLRESVAVVPYETVISVVLHYPFAFDVPYYALENADGDHALDWIYRESCKPGHVPDGEELLVVQANADWSVDRYDDADEEVVTAATEAVASVLDDTAVGAPDGESLTAPDWTDIQRWRYAFPDDGVDHAALEPGAEHDLYFAGDWVAGTARLHAALRNGLDVGDRIGKDLR